MGTILELNDAEVALTQAELAYRQAIYDYLTARADLEKTLGNNDLEYTINQK
jgi:outer membrane efflux protein